MTFRDGPATPDSLVDDALTLACLIGIGIFLLIWKGLETAIPAFRTESRWPYPETTNS